MNIRGCIHLIAYPGCNGTKKPGSSMSTLEQFQNHNVLCSSAWIAGEGQVCVTVGHLRETMDLPRGDRIEKGLWHTNQLRIAYSMHRCSARRVGDYVKLSNCISLTIFTSNYHFSLLSFGYGTQSPINDDVKAVTDVLWPPKNLASTDLHPVQ